MSPETFFDAIILTQAHAELVKRGFEPTVGSIKSIVTEMALEKLRKKRLINLFQTVYNISKWFTLHTYVYSSPQVLFMLNGA